MQKYTCIYWIHTDAMIKTQEDFFIKYMYLSLYCMGWKRVTQGLRVRGSWRPYINCNILTPLLWPLALCLSCLPDAQPEAHSAGWWLSLLHLISILSGPQFNRRPRAPSPFGLVWLSLPHLVYNAVWSLTVCNFNSSGAPRASSAWCDFPYHISSITPSDL